MPISCLTMMTPVSLLASMIETRQVLGRTIAMISSTSTRAVTLDTGTNVTSVTKHSYPNKPNRGVSLSFLVVKMKLCCIQLLLPALPSLCRCSAASLTESCSTLEVMMWGRPVHPFWCPSPCSAALQFLLKCSTAVWSTRLLAWKRTTQEWATHAYWQYQYFENCVYCAQICT